MSSIEEDKGEILSEEWGWSSASDPLYARDTVISTGPWVYKLIMWFLPTIILDIMIYFMMTVTKTVCTVYGFYNLL